MIIPPTDQKSENKNVSSMNVVPHGEPVVTPTRLEQNDNEINEVLSKVSPENKIPNIHGEKTIVCWNCLTVLMVKDEWSVVRCTNCDKINRVPGTENNVDSMIRLNDNMNHFDLYVPYVYAVITCPFCQSENKVRKDAEHVVCFQCHNSYNIQHEYKYQSPQGPQYPDPNSFQPPKIEKDDHSCKETQRLLKKLIKKIGKSKPMPYMPPPSNKYSVLRQLVRDVDEIDEKRVNRRKLPPSAKFHGNVGDMLEAPQYIPREINKVNKDFANDKEMEELKKKLYDEIRNDPKYKYKNRDAPKYESDRIRKNSISYDTKRVYEPAPKVSDNPKNEAVYRMMFTPEIKKQPKKASGIYGGLNFDF